MVDISFSGIAGSLGTSIGSLFLWGGVVILVLGVLTLVSTWAFKRKKWNLRVEFKMPRSDGRIIISEHGKGAFNARKGFCLLKRPGLTGPKYEIKNFDPTEYLQGTDTLTVIQVGPREFRPVIPDSYTEVINEKGEQALIMHIKADTGKDIAWQQTARRALREAFTIQNFLAQYGSFIGWGFLLLVVILGQFIGFGMILDRIKSG